MKNKVYTLTQIRKYLLKHYNLSDNDLTSYLITKYHLDHYPTREEIIKLEHMLVI